MQKKKIWWIVGLLLLVYSSSFGNYINSGDNYLQENGNWLALIDLVACSFCLMIVPCILRTINEGKFEFEKGKKICKWNSIIAFIISNILLVTIEMSFVGGLGAVTYYFINKWLFVEDAENCQNNNLNKFICNNCEQFVDENEEYCPNCGMFFCEEQEELFKCDNCGTVVRNIDNFCPKCGEIFEEDLIEEIDEKNLQQDDKFDFDEVVNLYLAKNYEVAKDSFKQYIKQNELDIADEKTFDFNNYAEFILYVKRFNKSESMKYITTKVSSAYLYLGMIEFENKNYDNSIMYLNNAIKNNPMCVTAMFEKVECYKAMGDLNKYFSETKKIYKYIYTNHDLAHYYRNLGYYFIEKKDWDIAKALYLYSVTKELSDTATHEITYICEKTNNKVLPKIEEVKEILEDNSISLGISEENSKIIIELYEELKKDNKHNSKVGIFIKSLIDDIQNNS